MPGKPLIFGDSSAGQKVRSAHPEGIPEETPLPRDIPGYAELVKARDLSKAEYINSGRNTRGLTESQKRDYYKRFGTEPKDSEWEFKWLRVSAPGGQNSHRADRGVMFAKRDGWEMVKLDSTKDAEEQFRSKYGYGFPLAAHLAADGSIRYLDVALFAMKGDTYRRLQEARSREKLAKLAESDQPQATQGAKTGIPITASVEDHGEAMLAWKPNV